MELLVVACCFAENLIFFGGAHSSSELLLLVHIQNQGTFPATLICHAQNLECLLTYVDFFGHGIDTSVMVIRTHWYGADQDQLTWQ